MELSDEVRSLMTSVDLVPDPHRGAPQAPEAVVRCLKQMMLGSGVRADLSAAEFSLAVGCRLHQIPSALVPCPPLPEHNHAKVAIWANDSFFVLLLMMVCFKEIQVFLFAEGNDAKICSAFSSAGGSHSLVLCVSGDFL